MADICLRIKVSQTNGVARNFVWGGPIFRDLHRPTIFGGGGGSSRNFSGSPFKLPSFGEFFLHFRQICRLSEIHCTKKHLPKVWGGGMAPLAPPGYATESNLVDLTPHSECITQTASEGKCITKRVAVCVLSFPAK